MYIPSCFVLFCFVLFCFVLFCFVLESALYIIYNIYTPLYWCLTLIITTTGQNIEVVFQLEWPYLKLSVDWGPFTCIVLFLVQPVVSVSILAVAYNMHNLK